MDQSVTMHHGVTMPLIGLGTYNLKKDTAFNTVLNALALGYRHLETAPIYLNLPEIKAAIAASNVQRETLFITSKIPPHIKTYEGTLRVAERIMKQLGTDYLDALLINNPVPWGEEGSDYSKENIEVYHALETLFKAGKARSIGVSNFDVTDLKALMPFINIKPHINQIGVFIGHTLDDIRAYCKANHIIVQGHSPLARGNILGVESLTQEATKLGITQAQLALGYVVEKGVAPIVKATNKTHLKANLHLPEAIPKSVMAVFDAQQGDVRTERPPKAKWVL